MTDQQPQLPPLAPGPWPFGSAKLFSDDPLGYMMRTIPEQGDIFRLHSELFRVMPAFSGLMVISGPDLVKHILQDNNRNYEKSYGYRVLEALLGKGLLTSEGDFWRKQRRTMQPAFHRERLAAFADIMAKGAEELAERWAHKPEGEVIDMSKEMMGLTLNIVTRAMFSTDVSEAMDVVNREFDRANEMLVSRIIDLKVVPLSWPLPSNIEERRTYKAIRDVVTAIIEKRRRSNERYDDLLAMLMEARDEETGETMSDRQVLDEVVTIFLAGHETTAVALTWLFYLLAQHPEEEQKVREEERAVLNGRLPLLEDMRTMPYTRMVIDETLRLYPPAWVIGRQTLAEDVVGGYRVPARTNCIMPVYYIHRDPRWWEQPDRFMPDRFAEGLQKARHRFSYFPFGGGPRLCIGNNFAVMEMQIIVPILASRFRLRTVPGHKTGQAPLITMRPEPNLRLSLHRNAPAHAKEASATA